MFIGKVCNRDVAIVDQDDSLKEAAEVMRAQHVGSVVVVQKARGGVKPVGILTDRDIVVEILASGVAMDAVAVKDVMSRDLLAAREDSDLFDVIERIRDKGVRRVPVVDGKGLLVGIASTDDLISLLAQTFSDLVSLIDRQQRRERKRRPAK
jgi:CBS domain-containing protein